MGNTKIALLTYDELAPHLDIIRAAAVQQLCTSWRTEWSREEHAKKPFLWGHEMEYMIASRRSANGVSWRQSEMLDALPKDQDTLYDAEMAGYMIEACPRLPYDGSERCLSAFEAELKRTRGEIQARLDEDEVVTTLACPMRMDADDAAIEFLETRDKHLQKDRYKVIAKGVQEKSRKGLEMGSSLFVDENTRRNLREHLSPEMYAKTFILPGHPTIACGLHIHGGGVAALQLTFQAPDLEHVRWLHDQLVCLAPVFLALTASSPIKRGLLSDTDTRWELLSAWLDDRTKDEEEGGTGTRYGSRMRSSPLFAFHDGKTEALNDVEAAFDQDILDTLCEQGMDATLARLYAQMLHRDPFIAPASIAEESFQNSAECLEAMVSPHYYSAKLKSPTHDAGWRIEFRVMEPQPTDFENAAVCTLAVLLVTSILRSFSDGLRTPDLRIPISRVNENFKRAQARDAVARDLGFAFVSEYGAGQVLEQPISMIVAGEHGLLGIARKSPFYTSSIEHYLEFVERRAKGQDPTPASRIREAVVTHGSYEKDSRLSREMFSDILKDHLAV